MSADEKLAALLSATRVFALPGLDSKDDGWGPSSQAAAFTDIPYAPFNKADKLMRVSDWLTTNRFYQNQYNRNRTFGAGSGAFGFTNEFEEASFNVVDNTPRYKPRDGRRRKKEYSFHNRRRRGRGHINRGRGRGGNRGGRGGHNQRRNNWNTRRWNYQPERKDPSIPIQDSWVLEDSIDLPSLNQIATKEPRARTLVSAGKVERYRDIFGRITPRNPVDLARFENLEVVTATTSEDPILRRLIEEKRGTVFGTDTIFATLMSAGRSANAWDLSCRKEDGVLVFDKRANSSVDYLTVNENWNEVQETDKKSMNHPTQLFQEATLINHNFQQQVLDSKREAVELQETNPFASLFAAELASVGYRYRSYNLSDTVTMVARCEVHGYTERNGEKKFLNVRALNDFDHTLSGGVDWRQKLELAPAAVLASEMKNNNCKLAKWASQMALSGADELRLGFVARDTKAADPSHSHQILAIRSFSPAQFTAQLQMRPEIFWAALKRIINTIMDQEDGDFVLLRDPNESKLHIYRVPAVAEAEEATS
jgi:translation initiation factor 3 subunit D